MTNRDQWAMSEETIDVIRNHTESCPDVAIILGTGLGALTENLARECQIDYQDLPHFAHSTVETHAGKLLFGTISGRSVVVMQGRFHYYEGYSMQEITYPLRVLHRIGARTLLVANAAGGLHPFYRAGDLMMLDDHINLLGDNPLVGPNDERFGERFPDMSEPYSRRLQRLAAKIARKADIDLHRGVYVAVAGPNLETRAEYRMLRNLGADAVGMSTVPEVIVARHMQMEVFGISAITDECFPDALKPASFTEIVKMGAIAEPKMTRIITDLISQI